MKLPRDKMLQALVESGAFTMFDNMSKPDLIKTLKGYSLDYSMQKQELDELTQKPKIITGLQ